MHFTMSMSTMSTMSTMSIMTPTSFSSIPINAYAHTQSYCISLPPSCLVFQVFSLDPCPRWSNQGVIDCCHEQPLFICITICAIHVPLPHRILEEDLGQSLFPTLHSRLRIRVEKVSIPELILSLQSSTWAAGSPTSITLPRGTRSWTYRTNSTQRQSLWHRAHPSHQRGRSRKGP
jgi:hypothetical protein